MKIEKKYLDEMKRCYCASNISFDGENHVLLASEDPEVACNMYYGKDFEKKQNVWTIPGGCMSIVPIPGKEKEFLAVQEFYLKVTPSLAKIVWGKYEDGEWKFKDVVSIPYVHRFGIFHANGINYLIAATVATSKKEKNDWSVPGRIYVAELPEDPSKGVELEILVDGLYRNHGFWQTKKGGKDVGYFGSDQGILRVSAPEKRGGQWKTELIMEGHIGEIATVDIDNDGVKELILSEGTCNADWINDVYCVNDYGLGLGIGSFARPVVLYEAPDGNGIYAVWGNQGLEEVTRITKNGSELEEELILSDSINYDENYITYPNEIMTAYANDYSLLEG